jgi:dephospho-CoA kinase
MITLGVTGGIGSGKSTACRIFEELGARVFYADDVAKRLMVEDADLREDIMSAFGEKTYDANHQLNRSYLADIVFDDAEKLQQLNALVHKRVRAAFYREREEAERSGVELLVEEAALIFETGIDEELDLVVVVDAPEEVRVQRVIQRDDTDEAAVRARMSHQLPAEEKRRRADFVLDNSKSVEALRAQVVELYNLLVG